MSRRLQTSRYRIVRGTGKTSPLLTDIFILIGPYNIATLHPRHRIDSLSSTPVTTTFGMEEGIGRQRASSAIRHQKTWPRSEPRKNNMCYAIEASSWLSIIRHAAAIEEH